MRQPSRRKKLLFSIVLLLVAIPAIEILLHLSYLIVNLEPFPFARHREDIELLADSPQSESSETEDEPAPGQLLWRPHKLTEVIHPYLGFVRDPAETPNTSYLGFPQKGDDPFARTADDSLVIAVLGGSFAEGVSIAGRAVLESSLRARGLNARVVTVAMGGYKQPQQLMTLAYLLSHGAQIDIVINIDGFNEVALPASENLPKGVDPFYPRAWYFRTRHMSDQETLRQMGKALALEDERRHWATVFRDLPAYSILLNLMWRSGDNLFATRIERSNDELRLSPPNPDENFLTTGPDWGANQETDLYPRIADNWKMCSRLMKALCDANEISYLHILQPNQYYEAGRSLTAEERQNAFLEESPYRPGVVEGYPRLVSAGEELIAQGIDFHDLTMIYHDIPQTVYVDTCCHPNKMGYEIIADYIAERITEFTR